MNHRTSPRRLRGAALAILAVAALAACEPVPHTTFTVEAAPGGGTDLALLSGNGRFVVVTAIAAGPLVPGAGTWRVDRTTGDVVALPDGTPRQISADGSRVLVAGTTGLALWDDGAESTAPSGVLSDDLTFRVYVGDDGTVQVQDLATGVVRAVEEGFPRPAGWVSPIGVSDRGNVVVFRFDATIRAIDLTAGTHLDIPSLATEGTDTDPPADEQVVLAAGGTALARSARSIVCAGPQCEQFWASIDLIAIPSGDVLAHHENATQEFAGFLRIADNGRAAWAYQERTVLDGDPNCPSAPQALSCVVSASLVELSAHGVEVDVLGPGRGIDLAVSANGRFAALTREQPGYRFFMPDAPVRVVDRLTTGPRWETLGGGTSPSARGRLSDDGRVISTTSETGGWYDFEA